MIPKSCKRLAACSASGHLQVLPTFRTPATSFGQLLAAMEKARRRLATLNGATSMLAQGVLWEELLPGSAASALARIGGLDVVESRPAR